MSYYLCAVTADGGVPLFTRRSGDLPALPFASVGVLNGIHMFSSLRGSELKNAVTPEEKIIWKSYHKCIVLILVTRNDNCDECHLLNLLDNIFASMVMLVGINNILKPPNIEKLKRDLKVSYPVIDILLNQKDEEYMTAGDLVQSVDILLTYESQTLLNHLDKFLEVVDSAYGCLFVKKKIATASKFWWSLTPQELVLISAHVHSLPKPSTGETSIYLPTTCPQTSNRLLTIQLLDGIILCVLCESTPTSTILEQEATKIWKTNYDLLQTISMQHPKNYPSSIVLDQNILGVFLLNIDTHQAVISLCLEEHENILPKEEKKNSLLFKQEALRTFYKQVVGRHFTDISWTHAARNKSDTNTEKPLSAFVNEFYMCTANHKCYAVNNPPHRIFILFNKNVPHYALRPVSHTTLKLLNVKKLWQ